MGIMGCLNSQGTSGGIIILWDRRYWKCIDIQQGKFSISYRFANLQEEFKWLFTGVYGPHTNPERTELWEELAAARGYGLISGLLVVILVPADFKVRG